ncbi:putative nuclear fragile X mental retardation-interacting protein [Plasmopara halstedii]
MERGGNFRNGRGGRGFGRGRGRGSGRVGRGRGRGSGGGGRGGRGSGFQSQRRHDDQSYASYPSPQHVPPQQVYPPPPQGFSQYPPQDQYQQQSGYNVAPPCPPSLRPDLYHQPVETFSQYPTQQFQQFSQYQQPQSLSLSHQYIQYHDETRGYLNNPQISTVPAPRQSIDFADAVQARQQAYAPVPRENDQQSFYQDLTHPIQPQDPRTNRHHIQSQDQTWYHFQQPHPLQFNGPPTYDQRLKRNTIPVPPSYSQDSTFHFQDRRQDSHDPSKQSNRLPPPTYVCHNCNQPGHWKQHCPLFENEKNQEKEFYQSRLNPKIEIERGFPSPLPGPKPQDPRRHFENLNLSSQPPLPEGPMPPLPTHAQQLPENYNRQEFEVGMQVWKCETCVKSFNVVSQYEAHLSFHVTCSNCDFTASKRVVGAHFQTAHGQYAGQGLKEIEVEGQKFMVLVGNSAEEIAKWREERRKNWLAMSKEPKTNRTNTFGTGKRKLSISSDEDLEEGEIEEDEEVKAKIVLQTGTTTSERVVDVSQQEPFVKKSRKIILCKYFSRGQCRLNEKQCKFSHDRSLFGCRAMMYKGSCIKGMYCPYSHDTTMIFGQLERKKDRVKEQQWRGEQKSLLRKLLAKDMRVEQRKMLQIVHFLVANEFFRTNDVKAEASEAITLETVTDEASADAKEECSSREVETNVLSIVESSDCVSQEVTTLPCSDNTNSKMEKVQNQKSFDADAGDFEEVVAVPVKKVVEAALDYVVSEIETCSN